MRKQTAHRRTLALLLAFALLLPACGGGGTKATTMHLKRSEGRVGVSDDAGKDVEPRDDLGLYSGYGVDTKAESYAWINLDEVKLAKLDEDSEIAITKDGKELEIEVLSGSLFFNVTEPLADDETMTIRASTMAVGIRGTCGWVTLSEDKEALSVYLLEGKVECTAGENTAAVSAGEMAEMRADGEIKISAFSNNAVPAFVQEELTEDIPLPELPDPQVLQEQLRSLVENLEFPLTVDGITFGVSGIEAAKSAYLNLPYAMTNPMYDASEENEIINEDEDFDSDTVYNCFGMNGMPIPEGHRESEFGFFFGAPYTGGGINHIEINQSGFLCLGELQVGDSQEKALAFFGLPDTPPATELTWTLNNGGSLTYTPHSSGTLTFLYQLNGTNVYVSIADRKIHSIALYEEGLR